MPKSSIFLPHSKFLVVIYAIVESPKSGKKTFINTVESPGINLTTLQSKVTKKEKIEIKKIENRY